MTSDARNFSHYPTHEQIQETARRFGMGTRPIYAYAARAGYIPGNAHDMATWHRWITDRGRELGVSADLIASYVTVTGDWPDSTEIKNFMAVYGLGPEGSLAPGVGYRGDTPQRGSGVTTVAPPIQGVPAALPVGNNIRQWIDANKQLLIIGGIGYFLLRKRLRI